MLSVPPVLVRQVSLFDLAFGAQKNAEKAQAAKAASADSWGTSAAAQHVTHLSLHDSDAADSKIRKGAGSPPAATNMFCPPLMRLLHTGGTDWNSVRKINGHCVLLNADRLRFLPLSPR